MGSQMLWVDKYKPTKISDIIGNENSISAIVSWLKNYDSLAATMKKKGGKRTRKVCLNVSVETADSVTEQVPRGLSNSNRKSCMIVTGNHGVGKTCIVTSILNTLGYSVKLFHAADISSSKDSAYIIRQLLSQHNIGHMITTKEKTKKVLVIDELESITNSNNRGVFQGLIKENDAYWKLPIIFITNSQHNKMINIIKHASYEIKIAYPTQMQMLELFVKICNEEKVRFEDQNLANMIIEHSKNDYRQMIFILQDLAERYSDKIIEEKDVVEYLLYSKKKDIDSDIFKLTNKMFSNYEGIDESIMMYETEKILIPLMIQQNYFQYILSGTYDVKRTHGMLKILEDVSVSISTGDVVENFIYGDQHWELKDIHGFFSCAQPSFMMRNIDRNSITDRQFPYFPLDLNRTSIKKINKKNIKFASQYFNNMNIVDYLYANNLFKQMIDKNDINSCIEILQGYNMSCDGIESILKIDKINKTKTTLPKSIKKKLQDYQ